MPSCTAPSLLSAPAPRQDRPARDMRGARGSAARLQVVLPWPCVRAFAQARTIHCVVSWGQDRVRFGSRPGGLGPCADAAIRQVVSGPSGGWSAGHHHHARLERCAGDKARRMRWAALQPCHRACHRHQYWQQGKGGASTAMAPVPPLARKEPSAGIEISNNSKRCRSRTERGGEMSACCVRTPHPVENLPPSAIRYLVHKEAQRRRAPKTQTARYSTASQTRIKRLSRAGSGEPPAAASNKSGRMWLPGAPRRPSERQRRRAVLPAASRQLAAPAALGAGRRWGSREW